MAKLFHRETSSIPVYTSEQIHAMMDNMRLFAESLGGLRRQLIEEQGFSHEAADSIVVLAIRNASNG